VKTTGLLAILLLAGIAGAAPVMAQDIAPEAASVLDRYVEASGGLAAFDKIQNRVTKATMEIAGAGIAIDLTMYGAKPNKAYTLINSDATGKIESGYNGEVAWGLSAMNGPQILEGKEKQLQENVNIFDRDIYWRDAFSKVEYLGEEKVKEAMCEKVKMHPANGAPSQTVYFDKDTGLIAKTETTIEGPMGQIQITAFPSDYREVDGISMAFKTTMEMMGQQRILTLNSMEHNVDMPADRFALPEEIKALLEKKKVEEPKEKDE
jgi:outer membrane lipoprotein-sorting protein